MKPLLLNEKSWSLRFIAMMMNEQDFLNNHPERFIRYHDINTSCDVIARLIKNFVGLCIISTLVFVTSLFFSTSYILTGILLFESLISDISLYTVFHTVSNTLYMVPLLLTVVFLIWLVILFISQSIEESDSDIIHVKIPEEIKQLATSFKEKACIPVKYKSD